MSIPFFSSLQYKTKNKFPLPIASSYISTHSSCIAHYIGNIKKKTEICLLLSSLRMSGVWVFKNGVVRLMENPESEILEKKVKGKVLVDMASGEPITSYTVLERKLKALGWERYYDDPNLLQFHKTSSIDLISLPKDFTNFTNIHMYDIVIKNRNYFQVTDM